MRRDFFSPCCCACCVCVCVSVHTFLFSMLSVVRVCVSLLRLLMCARALLLCTSCCTNVTGQVVFSLVSFLCFSAVLVVSFVGFFLAFLHPLSVRNGCVLIIFALGFFTRQRASREEGGRILLRCHRTQAFGGIKKREKVRPLISSTAHRISHSYRTRDPLATSSVFLPCEFGTKRSNGMTYT